MTRHSSYKGKRLHHYERLMRRTAPWLKHCSFLPDGRVDWSKPNPTTLYLDWLNGHRVPMERWSRYCSSPTQHRVVLSHLS